MEKHSVSVTGKVYSKGASKMDEGFEFEIELPYEDISQDVMPIEESNELIFNAINRKYETEFFQAGYNMNPVRIKKEK